MTKDFAKGEVIFRERDNGDCFYDVKKGTIGIFSDYGTDDEQQISLVEEGHILGEMALVDAFPRSATAVALTDVTADEVTVEDMKGFFKTEPERVTHVIQELGSKLANLTAEYSEACENMDAAVDKHDATFGEKITKFVKSYQMTYKSNKISSETYKTLVQTGHGDGFSKHVDSYREGTIIFKEMEPGRCMYDIHTGSVNIYTGYGTPEECLLTTLGSNKFFGEIGLLGNTNRTATAVAASDGTTIETISMDDFEELYQKNPGKIEMLIKHMASRIRLLTNDYVDACQLIYEYQEAEEKGYIPEGIRERVKAYRSLY